MLMFWMFDSTSKTKLPLSIFLNIFFPPNMKSDLLVPMFNHILDSRTSLVYVKLKKPSGTVRMANDKLEVRYRLYYGFL